MFPSAKPGITRIPTPFGSDDVAGLPFAQTAGNLVDVELLFRAVPLLQGLCRVFTGDDRQVRGCARSQ